MSSSQCVWGSRSSSGQGYVFVVIPARKFNHREMPYRADREPYRAGIRIATGLNLQWVSNSALKHPAYYNCSCQLKEMRV